MSAYIALLRAVNVGGTGKLPMSELKSMCESTGFRRVRTYIASGNVVFDSPKSKKQVKQALEAALEDYAGKPVGVHVRTPAEMKAIHEANPFLDKAANRTVVIFLGAPPPADALDHAKGVKDEEMALGSCEIYVHYGDGMGQSKLRIPAAKDGTARNINTVAKLVEMSNEAK